MREYVCRLQRYDNPAFSPTKCYIIIYYMRKMAFSQKKYRKEYFLLRKKNYICSKEEGNQA